MLQKRFSETIPDDRYNGYLSSMRCIELMAPPKVSGQKIAAAMLTLAIDHTYVGDLTVKIKSPGGDIYTLLQRPVGDNGSNPGSDDGDDCCGDASNLLATYPISFSTEAKEDAETLGKGLTGDQVVCKDGGACTFKANADKAKGHGFGDLVGEELIGTWKVCVGDSEPFDAGEWSAANLLLLPAQ